jgi:pheromone shutdown protein TraB
MYNITLICTLHREHGKCNSEELYKIIEKINPEIIFEEISNFRLDAYYTDKTYKSLETNTIMKYLEKHQIEHIPVDNHGMTESQVISLYKNFDYMNEQLSYSAEYTELWEKHMSLTIQGGFDYINSNGSDELMEKIETMKKYLLKIFNNELLFNAYTLFNEIVIDKREYEMIKNIYKYSKEHKVNNAIFLIGAEHRRSIINKIQEYERKNELKLNWNYNIK